MLKTEKLQIMENLMKNLLKEQVVITTVTRHQAVVMLTPIQFIIVYKVADTWNLCVESGDKKYCWT